MQRLWWARGFFSALALLGIIANYTNWDSVEFLEIVHASLIGWNRIVYRLTELLSSVPYIPHINTNSANSIIIISSVVLPVFGHEDTMPDRGKRLYTYIAMKRGGFLFFIPGIIATALFFLVIFYMLRFSLSGIYSNSLYLLVAIPTAAYTLFKLLENIVILEWYRRGFVTLLTFLATLEALYFLNIPFISEGIYNFSREVLDGNTYSK